MFSQPVSTSRPKLAKASARLLALCGALILVSGAAFAQDKGTAAFDAYVKGLEKLGVEIETGAVAYDEASDTLTVTNPNYTFSGTIRNLPPKETEASGKDGAKDMVPSKPRDLAFAISMSSGSLAITGLIHEDGDFKTGSWTHSDDTRLLVTGSVENEGRLKVEGRLAGISATGYSFTLPEIPAEDPDHPVSRWLPFMQALFLTSYEEVRIDSTGLTFEGHASTDGKETLAFSGTSELDGYRMADAEKGWIGEYSIDLMTQDLRTLDPATGRMLRQTTRQGKTVYRDIDAAAIVDLFDPDVPVTGEEETLIGSGSMVDYESSQDLPDGKALKTSVERGSIRDITVVKQGNSLLSMLDQLLNKKAPAPEELIAGVFQFYRSFAIADARISGISVEFPSPGPAGPGDGDVGITIREMAMTDISSEGIGEMLIVGLDAPELPQGSSVKLDWAAIGDIEFAEYSPMRAMIATLMADPNYGESNPLDVARAFLPRSFGYEIEGLDVNLPEIGRTQIGKAEMTLSTSVPPVPTSLYVKNDGIRVPVSAIEDEDTKALLQALGLETLDWSDETRLYWDEATLELRLERLMLDIKGLGKAEASARFANVPKALFEDPQGQGQMAAIVAQFVDASVVFKDGGLTAKGLAHVAEQQGIPENVFREALVAQATEATAVIGNEAFTRMVSEAVSAFLKDPREFRVTLKPENPVPMAQILGSMATPQVLPVLLNVNIEAN
ncbi:hypothetical protein [Roseibium marinum]|uniref:DUF2125 domain-containing protein n=1 Tax=Roseibium marinum TaxID=281252 RepID=A0A2S3V3K7_9HYPH|nr:hypothetical protein [Roseibium marinum]POF34249.1 hypothetical protein CLV41_101702 [Roseibium marinum]